MPTSHEIREERIREAVAWVRLQGLAAPNISPNTVQLLRNRFVGEYFYSRQTADELAVAVLRRIRHEQTISKLNMVKA